MRYGVPYKGSKSRIVERMVSAIPYKGIENFYDLFAGGCAVTHKMLLDKRYKHYYANDINGQGLRLFNDAIAGKYSNEKRWVSRDDFFRLKDTNSYVSICWSFGNNQRDYLYSKKIEPYKKACHYAIVLNDFSLFRELCSEVTDVCEEALKGIVDTYERRIKFGSVVVSWLKKHGTLEMINANPLYSSCHVKKNTKSKPKGEIRNMQSLESLERLQSLEISTSDYRLVEIKPNSIVYCDIPYKGCDGYNGSKKSESNFNHDLFYDWCYNQTELVLISEYDMPSDRFTKVWAIKSIQTLSLYKTSSVEECLFVPTFQLERYKELMRESDNNELFKYA